MPPEPRFPASLLFEAQFIYIKNKEKGENNMFIYAVSQNFPSPLSSNEPIFGIPLDELRTKSRRKALADAYLSGGLLNIDDENIEHIEQLVFYGHLKIGVGESIVQAIENCLKHCVFSVSNDFENLGKSHIWAQHRRVSKPLLKDVFEMETFTLSDFQLVNPLLSSQDALLAIDEMLKYSVIKIKCIK